jgi:DNA polymerase III delta prime subunit
MSLWFEKYRPQSIEDIVVSENKVNFINEWFEKFKAGEQTTKALLFTGPPGLGKTSLAHAVLKKHGYNVVEFNASDVRSKTHINEKLDSLVNFTNVNSVVEGVNVKTAIIMDEVDGMFKGDRGGIDELLSFISMPTTRKKSGGPISKVPIICICNLGNIKRDTIKQLQKECQEINFTLPDHGMMGKLLTRIARAENLTIDQDAADFIIEWSQADFRRLVGILEFLAVQGGGTVIDLPMVQDYHKVLNRKEKDVYITDSIKRLLNDMLPINEVNTIYNADKSKAPMVVHQNYLKAIDKQHTGYKNKIANAINTIDSLVVSDIIEKHMYNSQHWHLQTVQGLACTYVPNYYINRFKKLSPANSTWASVLSISSQSQNLKKNMYEIISQINGKRSYTIEDVQYLIEIILQSIMDTDYIKAIKLIMGYNICDVEELKTKKCIPVIDKLVKFIKISPYYTKWEEFKEKHKNNKDIDTAIKEAIATESANITGVKIRIQSKPKGIPVAAPEAPRIIRPAAATAAVAPAMRSIEEQKELQTKRKTVTIKKKDPTTNI